MKRIINLSENKLRSLIESSIKNVITERINYQKGVKFINESMEMPTSIERVWVLKDDDDIFLIKGSDGYFYDVYPLYHDSYRINSDSDDYIDNIASKVEQSFINHSISAHVWNHFGQLAIEIADGNYNGEFDEAVKAWLERHGFKLEHYNETYNAYFYDYEGGSSDINAEKLRQKLSKYYEITDMIIPYLSGDSIMDGRNLAKIYKIACN